MFSSWGAAKAPPSTSGSRIPAPPPPTRQSRVRDLWAAFEQWHAQARGAADAKRVEAYKTLDKQYKSNNKKNRPSKAEHEKAKEQKAREIDLELVHTARDEWERRLDEAGLRAEDWDDMSVGETRAVEKLLGDRYEDMTPTAAPAPAAGSPRGGFVFVDPKALSDDEGGDGKKAAHAHHPQPSDDPAFRNRGALGYASWGIDSAASSAVSLSSLPAPSSAHSSTPSSARTSPSAGHVPLPPSFSFHAVTSASASVAANASPQPRKHRSLRYVGPVLCEDAHSEEEADFEDFKVSVRIAKICEFHDDAAQEDIRLAVELLRLRKEHKRHGTEHARAKEEERALVAAHEARMLALQRVKEDERHSMVAEEREKRRAEIMRRTQVQHVLEGRTLESRAHLATPTPETIRKTMERVEEEKRRREGLRPANTRLVELQGSVSEPVKAEAPRGVEVARAPEPAQDAQLQEMLRRAEADGRRLAEEAQRRRAATQTTSASAQLDEVLDMPGGLPVAPSAPVATKKVEPVKKATPSPPPPAKKAEPAPAKKTEPAQAPAPAVKKEPAPKKGKKAAAKKAAAALAPPAKADTATPTKAPPPSPSLSSPSLSVSSSTSSALSSSTSTTLTTPAPSRQDSAEDLARKNDAKAAGKRVAFSPTVEADERAAAKEKAAQASWGWGDMMGSLSTALRGEQPAAEPAKATDKGKGKEREKEDEGLSRQALVADLRAQAQETLAGFPADTRAQVEGLLREWPGEEGSEVGAPTAYQHVQQPGMWRPPGSLWGEAKAEPNDGWSLEQLAARALQQGFIDTPAPQASMQPPATHVPGHRSPPHALSGISPAHSAGTHSPSHIPGHYSPPQQPIYASPYAAHSQPALNQIPASFSQGHYAPAQYSAQPARYSPPQAPVGSFSPPQPASHEIWLPKPEPAKEAKRGDAHHAPKPAEVKPATKQPEVKSASKPEVKSAFKQPEVKPAARAVPKAPEVKPVPKVEAKPKVSAPQLASHLEKNKAKPVADVGPQKAAASSKAAAPKAAVTNAVPVMSKSHAVPAPHVKVTAPPPVKAPVQPDAKHQIWFPSNAARPRNQQPTLPVPGSPALEHSATLPAIAHPTPLLAGSRPRRMSDPVSPSPRMFDRPPAHVADDAAPPTHPPVPGILKKVKEHIPSKANAKKPRAIPVEVIPDTEGEPLNVLPSDARSLLEPVTVAPRPSAPPHAFTQIFDYDEHSTSAPQASSAHSSKQSANGDSAGVRAANGKNDKAKHVRWTPNVAGNANPAGEGPSAVDAARQALGKQVPGRPPMRPRASMPATGAEKQSAAHYKEKAGDDLQRFAVEAIENLKQVRSKPPSAV